MPSLVYDIRPLWYSCISYRTSVDSYNIMIEVHGPKILLNEDYKIYCYDSLVGVAKSKHVFKAIIRLHTNLRMFSTKWLHIWLSSDKTIYILSPKLCLFPTATATMHASWCYNCQPLCSVPCIKASNYWSQRCFLLYSLLVVKFL